MIRFAAALALLVETAPAEHKHSYSDWTATWCCARYDGRTAAPGGGSVPRCIESGAIESRICACGHTETRGACK